MYTVKVFCAGMRKTIFRNLQGGRRTKNMLGNSGPSYLLCLHPS